MPICCENILKEMLERIIWFLELVIHLVQVFEFVWHLLESLREFRNANPHTPQSSIEDEYDLQLIDAMSSNGGERAP
jgi:hypothetical protein